MGIQTPLQIALLAAFILFTVASVSIAVARLLRWSESRTLFYRAVIGVLTLAFAIVCWLQLYQALATGETYTFALGRRTAHLAGRFVDGSIAPDAFWISVVGWYVIGWLFSVFSLCTLLKPSEQLSPQERAERERTREERNRDVGWKYRTSEVGDRLAAALLWLFLLLVVVACALVAYDFVRLHM